MPRATTTSRFQPVLNHCTYLDSISSIYGKDIWHQKYPNQVVNALSLLKKEPLRHSSKVDLTRITQNISNSWFNEYVFNELQKSKNPLFIPWAINVFYYSIYSSLSAVANCSCLSLPKSHQSKINTYNNLLKQPVKQGYFLPPFCFYHNTGRVEPEFSSRVSWPYGLKDHCPKIENALLETQAYFGRPFLSLFDYFRMLREKVLYYDMNVFANLYGDRIIQMYWGSLERILQGVNNMNENFLNSYLGYNFLENNFNAFEKNLRGNFSVDYKLLKERFNVYKNMFS